MRNARKAIVLSILCGCLVLTMHLLKPEEGHPLTFSRDNRPVDLPISKKILIWTLRFKSAKFWPRFFQEIANKQCPQSNCDFTMDRTQQNTSDAVIFHLRDLQYKAFPKYRDPKQIWIGLTHETPHYDFSTFRLDSSRFNGAFNRTMSYRTDGDIFSPYGTFTKIAHNINIPSTASSSWANSHDTIQTRNYAEGKSRLVSWFVSYCNTQSGREKYVKQLKNFIQVDIYGGCGPLKCGRPKHLAIPYKLEEDECYKMVSMKYKFVLAFENSLCEDYVTEKLYNHLKLNVVPVVLGAANYSRFAPPHSVIEASRYTPKELAIYLQRLDKNDTEYNKYFRWKKDYQVLAHDGVPLVCSLCEQLHNPKWQKESKVYEHFDKWLWKGCKKT